MTEKLASGPVQIYDANGKLVPGRDAMARARSAANALVYGDGYGGGGYAGAKFSKRSMREFNPANRGADGDTIGDLQTLRARSRDLARNSALGAGAIETPVLNMIGPGLRLNTRPNRLMLGLEEEAAQEWQMRTEFLWQASCDGLDITGEQTFGELTALALMSKLASGDVFVYRRQELRPGDLCGLKVQMIEADRCRTPDELKGKEATSEGRLVAGIERDRNGRAVAYHFADRHPLELGGRGRVKYARVRAVGRNTGMKQVLHLFDRKRPGTTRGVPFLHAVIEPLKQLERFTEAELMAAVVASYFTIFVKTEAGEGFANESMGTDDGEDGVESPSRDLELGQGIIADLQPGEDVTAPQPGRPSTTFGGFVEAMATQIGVGLNMPAEVILKQFKASYSASRAALLEAWRFYKTGRASIAKHFCQPIYEWWLFEMVARGTIEAPGFFDDPVARAAWSRTEWIGPPQGQLDPTRETAAARERIDIGISSPQRETGEISADDFYEITDENARALERRRAAGLIASASPPASGDDDDDDRETDDDTERDDDESRDDDDTEDEARR